jgi:hypothetical protein
MAGIHFIQNDLRTSCTKPWIALNPAAYLGLGCSSGVVQNDTISLHIELAIGIARDA